MPLYEYACPSCATVFSRLRPLSAAGEGASCPRCGASAGRSLAPFAVHRSQAPPVPAAPGPSAAGPQLCQRYPHIPLLCHMEAQAARRWIAKAEGREEQYLEREARQQEAAARAGHPPLAAPSGGERHHVDHVHATSPRQPGRREALRELTVPSVGGKGRSE